MPDQPSQIVIVQWPRFGPYHLARLNAAAEILRHEGFHLKGLEIAGQDEIYSWEPIRTETTFERQTLFPNNRYEAVGRRQLWSAISGNLDGLQPATVAICGYVDPAAQTILAWCRFRGRPAILMSDSKADATTWRHFWKKPPKRFLVSLFSAALCAGSPQLAYLEQLGMERERIFLGYDAVDNDYFCQGAESARREPEQARQLPGLELTKPFFLTSARFIRCKNLPGLLDAYRIYRQQIEPDQAWRLVIIGDGPERHHLEQIIQRSNIPETCLPGFRQLDELPAYYGLAGAFILPSWRDQWGLVVNEAMAAGLPVLVSEGCGCVPDLIDPGRTGYRFDPADISGLAQLMIQVSSDNFDRQAMGAAAQAHISHWGPDRFAKGLLAAVNHVLKRGI